MDSVEEAAKIIAGSSYAVALVGAGLSVESGVPTFRGPGGLWTRVGQPSMNGYKQFLADPAAWWEHQVDRDAIDRAEPNPGHYALAELEAAGLLKMTISQNVDDLHFKAGSSKVAEIHGNAPSCAASSARRGGQEASSRSTAIPRIALTAVASSRAIRLCSESPSRRESWRYASQKSAAATA